MTICKLNETIVFGQIYIKCYTNICALTENQYYYTNFPNTDDFLFGTAMSEKGFFHLFLETYFYQQFQVKTADISITDEKNWSRFKHLYSSIPVSLFLITLWNFINLDSHHQINNSILILYLLFSYVSKIHSYWYKSSLTRLHRFQTPGSYNHLCQKYV